MQELQWTFGACICRWANDGEKHAALRQFDINEVCEVR